MGIICGKLKPNDKKILESNTVKKEEKITENKENKDAPTELDKSNTGEPNLTNINTNATTNKENKENIAVNETPKKQETKSERNIVALDCNVYVSKGNLNPKDIYLKKKILGQGSFGTVYLVKHRQLYQYFAMKVIKKMSKNKDEEENLMNEINILRQLDHPNILKITDFYNCKNEYNIITEYCQEGELFDEIKAKAPFDETLAGWYMRQILSAVCYCHNMNIVHRDLKPENILIVKRAKTGFHPIKIIDFGTAKVFHKEKSEHLLIGSAYYIAPEVLMKNYTEKCDLWSCGVIMYILLTGRPPFNGSNEEEIMKKIVVGQYEMSRYPWGIVSDEAKDLIKGLLEINPNKRLSALDALNHKWFKSEKVKASENVRNIKEKNLNKLIENLTKYKSDNILRCAVIAYLVHNNTQLNQAHEAVKLFNRIDKNGDGKISREELFDGLLHFLKSPTADKLKSQVEQIFNNIDTDHNNYIEYEEFVRAAIDKEYFLSDAILQFAFNYFDRDRNGTIGLDEIRNLFYQNDKNKHNVEAQQQLKKCFEEIDVNGDGVLSFDEFVKMMKNIIRQDS